MELAVLEIDVVHDLGDLAEREIPRNEALDEHFERAAVALVGELAARHVEAQLRRGRAISGGDELELGLAVDPAADEPRARHAIDEDALARDPGAAAMRWRHGRRRLWRPARRGMRDGRFRDGARRHAETVHGGEPRQTSLQGPQAAGARAAQPLGALGNRQVLRLPGLEEHGGHILVRASGDEARLAQRRFAAFARDLARPPLERRGGRVGVWEDVDRILDGPGTQGAQPARHFDAQVVGLLGKLMDEEEPGRGLRRRRHGMQYITAESYVKYDDSYAITAQRPRVAPASSERM